MAKNETRRNGPKVLQDDKDAHDAIKGINNYEPMNPAYEADALQTARTAMETAQAAETQADAALKTARDAANAKEWAFHNLVLGAKTQIVAQYGEYSDQVQSIGLKKKSEYRAPSRSGTPAPAGVH